jgi:hypothetical protein
LWSGWDLSSTGRVIREITAGCAAVGGASVLVVAFLGLAVIRAVLQQGAEPSPVWTPPERSARLGLGEKNTSRSGQALRPEVDRTRREKS